MRSSLSCRRCLMIALLFVLAVLGMPFLAGCRGCSSGSRSDTDTSPRIVLDANDVKYWTVPLHQPPEKRIYRVVVATSSTPVTDASAGFFDLMLSDPSKFEWEDLGKQTVWPIGDGATGEPVKSSFCGVLIEVRDPDADLVKGGPTRLYDEEVNVLLRVMFSSLPDHLVKADRESGAGFALKGDKLVRFIRGEALDSPTTLNWEDGKLVLGTVFTWDDDVVYRQIVSLEDLGPPERNSED